MKRILSTLAAVLFTTAVAQATASYGCTNGGDTNVANLDVEAVTSRDGKYLDNLRGELQLDAGVKIEFDKKDVKSHHWGKSISVVLFKRTPEGPVEVRIYAKLKPDDDIEFVGNYVVTAGKVKRSGKIICSGG